MELTGPTLLARTRRLLNDIVPPYFLSDDELYNYLSEAQRQFASKTGGLIMSKTYSTVAGQSYISTPQLSIETASEIVSAWHVGIQGRKREIGVVGQIPPQLQPPESGISDLTDSAVESGPPVAVAVGLSDLRTTVVPVPDAVYSIQIDYRGLPDEDIGPSAGPVLPPRYQLWLPYGAAVMAFPTTAEEHFDKSRFTALEEQWLMVLNEAYVEHRVRYNDAGAVQFDGNGLW